MTFKICPQQFKANPKILLLIGMVACYIPARRLCSKSPEPEPNDSSKIFKKFLPNAKFGSVRPKELCVFFACFFFVFPFFLFFLFLFLFLFFFYYSSPVWSTSYGRLFNCNDFFLFLYINFRIFYLTLWRIKNKLVHQVLRETID